MFKRSRGVRAGMEGAKNNIIKLFLEQCTHGAQSEGLKDEQRACGQFIGKDAGSLGQRGLHGTAAAVRVLASADSEEAGKCVKRLVCFLEDNEEALGEHAQDATNVIKLSEVLYALSYVQPATADKDELVRRLAEKLTEGMVKQKGWSYFLGEGDNEPMPLPTAYALRGLAVHGYSVDSNVA